MSVVLFSMVLSISCLPVELFPIVSFVRSSFWPQFPLLIALYTIASLSLVSDYTKMGRLARKQCLRSAFFRKTLASSGPCVRKSLHLAQPATSRVPSSGYKPWALLSICLGGKLTISSLFATRIPFCGGK